MSATSPTTTAKQIPANTAHLIARRVELVSKSSNWKDQAAGWHKYRVFYTFDDGTQRSETMTGRADDCLHAPPEVDYCHCGASRPVGDEAYNRPIADGHVKAWT